jgi:hypothetical protein
MGIDNDLRIVDSMRTETSQGRKTPGKERLVLLKETKHRKRTAVPLPPGLEPLLHSPARLVRDSVQAVRGPEFLRRDPARRVHGVEISLRTLVQAVHGPEILLRDRAQAVRGSEILLRAPEFQPLDLEWQRMERRCAM